MAVNSGRCGFADCWLIPRTLMRLPMRRFIFLEIRRKPKKWGKDGGKPLKKNTTVTFPQNDGHTEELEIKRDELVGVQWKTRKREDVLTKNEVPPHIILCTLPTIDLYFATTIYGKKVRVPVVLDIRDMWPDSS